MGIVGALGFLGFGHRFSRDAVRTIRPARQILQLAPFTAERAIRLDGRMTTAQDAKRRRLPSGHQHILADKNA
jgi:hypothetical protein